MEAKREASWWVSARWVWLTKPSCWSLRLKAQLHKPHPTSPHCAQPRAPYGRLKWKGHGLSRAALKAQRCRNGFREAFWSQGAWDQRLSDGPGARVCSSAGPGLGKSAGASDFLLKAMGTHRRVSNRMATLVILGRSQKECEEIKSKRPVRLLV